MRPRKGTKTDKAGVPTFKLVIYKDETPEGDENLPPRVQCLYYLIYKDETPEGDENKYKALNMREPHIFIKMRPRKGTKTQ